MRASNPFKAFFLQTMLLHNLKVFQKLIKHHLLAIHSYNSADQILTYDHDHQMLICLLVI